MLCGVGVGGQLTAVLRSSAGHSIPRSGPAAAAVVATPTPAQQQLRYNFNSYHFTITWNPLPSQRTRRAWRPSDGTSPTWTGAGSWPCCCSYSSCPRRASSGSGGLLVTRAWNKVHPKVCNHREGRRPLLRPSPGWKRNAFTTAPLSGLSLWLPRAGVIPLQMIPMGMWGPENMKIKNIWWRIAEFYVLLY